MTPGTCSRGECPVSDELATVPAVRLFEADTTACGPDRVKTRSEFGGSGAAVCQFGLELPKYLDEAEDGGHKRSFSGPHGLDQRPATQYFHHALKIIGKHVESHFGTDPIQCSGQEVRAAHP